MGIPHLRFDSISVMGLIAQEVTRISLGTAVTPPTLGILLRWLTSTNTAAFGQSVYFGYRFIP